jgi:molecular chaperone DnaJ
MQQGVYTIMSTCRACGGAGSVIKEPCRKCSGLGVQRKPKSVAVNIPPGVDTGVNLRLAGEGDCGLRGAPAGNLFVRINVEADPFFERDGTDIHVKVPLSISQAVMGATISVPTVKGEADVVVPPGTQPGDTVVLRGKGVRRLGASSSGNMVVHLQLQVPKPPLSVKAKELLTALEAELKGSSGASSGTASASWAKSLADTLGRIRKGMGGAK